MHVGVSTQMENISQLSVEHYTSVMLVYEEEMKSKGSCTVRQLAKISKVSIATASKVIHHYKIDFVPKPRKQGHGLTGVGSLKYFRSAHHRFLFNLWESNPWRPREDYIDEFLKEFNLRISPAFLTKWFHEAGKYKGTMRKTSKFPPNKFSQRNLERLRSYISLIKSLQTHKNLVFADKKTIKEIDIYGRVRRNILAGEVPAAQCNANSRNRYNILAAVSVKEGLERNVEHLLIEASANAFTFNQFVIHLIEVGFLNRGDYLVVNNCSIHNKGDNSDLGSILWDIVGALQN